METRRIVALAASTALLFALVGCSTGGDESATDDTSSDSSTSESTETETEEAAPGAPEFVSDAPDGSPVMTLSESGFSPTTLTISSGDTVVFTTEKGIYGVIVAGLDGTTVTKGLNEYYKFTDKGSYPVEEDISGAEATIVVK